MNIKSLSESNFSLLEKEYLAGRMACLFFLLFNIFWFFDSINQPVISLIAFAGIIIFSTQFIFQIKIINGVLGGLSILLCIYFMLNVIGEFSNFAVATSEAFTLLIVGVALSVLGMVSSFLMLRSLLNNS